MMPEARIAATGYSIRAAREDELPVCAAIWRHALNDYLVRLNQFEIPDDLSVITRLYRHLRITDPGRFCVAVRPDPEAPERERIVGFASAVVRGSLWYLSMLFILPDEQGAGIGRALLARVMPPAEAGMTLATGTDSGQPISNALYSTYGIVPRMPLLRLVGDAARPETLAALPSGVAAVPFDGIAAGPAGGPGHRELVAIVGELDRTLAGFEHPDDHRFLRTEGRLGFLYRGSGGTPLGYGYTSQSGRIGPVAVRDPDLLEPVLGHLLRAVTPRGEFASWVPGHADRAVVALLRAGLRLEGFPVLLCWSRAFADFSRYLPISPGLL